MLLNKFKSIFRVCYMINSQKVFNFDSILIKI